MDLGWSEILLIIVVILLLFGGRKIPELMKGLGQGMREFKKAARGEDEQTSNEATYKNVK
jgi:sec-independent protein translocase protein TatA